MKKIIVSFFQKNIYTTIVNMIITIVEKLYLAVWHIYPIGSLGKSPGFIG